jgi:hypothetical protein
LQSMVETFFLSEGVFGPPPACGDITADAAPADTCGVAGTQTAESQLPQLPVPDIGLVPKRLLEMEDLETHGVASADFESDANTHYNPEEAWQTVQIKKLAALAVELISCHVWAFSVFSTNLPELYACIYHPTPSIAESMLADVRKNFHILLRAEKLVFPDETEEKQYFETAIFLRKCLDAIGYHNSSLVREWGQMAENCEWDYRNRDLRTSSFNQWGGVENTQKLLESVFQETREQTRQSRNAKMTCLRAQHHMSLAPRLRGSAVNTLNLTQVDWEKSMGVIDETQLGDAPFRSGNHELHPLLRNRLEAGPLFKQVCGLGAERRSCSATKALASCAGDEFFRGIDNCWLSMLLGGHLVYRSVDTSKGR